MPDLVFFYSVDDPCVARESLRLGHTLLLNKDYDPEEDLILLSAASNPDVYSFRNFYVLPDDRFISEISMGSTTKERTGRDFRYINDRVGAAAISLILNAKPWEGEVSVGDLAFQTRTYRSVNEPLEARPQSFSRAFQNLRSFIKRSAQPVPNKLFPKTVYVFPQALALLRKDFSRSPWPSLEIKD